MTTVAEYGTLNVVRRRFHATILSCCAPVAGSMVGAGADTVTALRDSKAGDADITACRRYTTATSCSSPGAIAFKLDDTVC
jgi:hypothetical protein